MHAKLTSTQDMISTASSFVVAEYVFNRGVDGKVSNETRVSLFGKRHFILFFNLAHTRADVHQAFDRLHVADQVERPGR